MKRSPPAESSPIVWTANDGTVLSLRHIRADDVARLMSFVRQLSFGTRYFRYGHGDIEFDEEHFLRVCTPDPGQCVHFLVVKRESEGGAETVLGSARIIFDAGGTSCEVVISVTDKWQSRGIGQRLMDALIGSARRRGLREMHAHILASNRRMIKFMQGQGFEIADSDQGPSVKIATMAL